MTNQVRYDMPMHQVLMFHLESPPATPQLTFSQDMTPVIRPLLATIANIAGSEVGKSPARTFSFNLLAMNNWNNPAYGEVCQMAVNLLALYVTQRRFNDYSQGLIAAATDALKYFAAIQLVTNQMLVQVSPPDFVGNARNIAQEWSGISTMFPQPGFGQPMMSNQGMGMQGSYPQQFQQPMQQQQFPQQFPQNPQAFGGGMPNMGNQVTTRFGNNQPQSMPGFGNPGRGFGSGTIGSNLGAPNQGGVVMPGAPGVGRSFTPPVQHAPVMMPTTVPLIEVDNSYGEDDELSVADWFPSHDQYYRTAFNRRTHYNVFTYGEDDVVIESINLLQESEVDRSKHTLTSIPRAHAYDVNARVEAVEATANTLQAITTVGLEEAGIDVKEYIKSGWLATPTLELALFDARASRLALTVSEDPPSIFRCFSVVAKPFVSRISLEQIMHRLCSKTSFAEIAREMKDQIAVISRMVKDGNPGATDVDLFLSEVENLLTDTINDFIANKLSLPSVTISDFVGDIGGLHEYLSRSYGYIYENALDAYETVFVDMVMSGLDKEAHTALADMVSVPGLGEECYTFLAQRYSFTFIDLWDSELGLGLEEVGAVAIIESVTPLLYKVAKSLFDQQGTENQAFHNLLITQDNVRYELHKGIIGKDTFLISKYHS